MKVARAKAPTLISIANNNRKILKVAEQALKKHVDSNYPVPLHLLVEDNINLVEYMFALIDKYIVPNCSDDEFEFMYEYIKYVCSSKNFTSERFNIKNVFEYNDDFSNIYNYYLTSVIKNNTDKFDIDEVFSFYINNIYSMVCKDDIISIFKSITEVCGKCDSYLSYREKIVQGITKDLINDLSNHISIDEKDANNKINFALELINSIISISNLDINNEKVQLCFDTINKIKDKIENYGMLS